MKYFTSDEWITQFIYYASYKLELSFLVLFMSAGLAIIMKTFILQSFGSIKSNGFLLLILDYYGASHNVFLLDPFLN